MNDPKSSLPTPVPSDPGAAVAVGADSVAPDRAGSGQAAGGAIPPEFPAAPPGDDNPGPIVVRAGGEGPASDAPSGEELASGTAGIRPSFIFFGVVAAISLLADVTTKGWAEIVLSERTLADPSIVILEDHLGFRLAYNKAGAWGLLAGASEAVRRPFFLVVSVAAILFIVSLYGRLMPGQRALKWGLPLVLGGALGNLSDRITRQGVIDFIDYRADWIETMNRAIASIFSGWSVTDHWPTFNVADISICIGVGLMAVDMVTSHRAHHHHAEPQHGRHSKPGSDQAGDTDPPPPGLGTQSPEAPSPPASTLNEPAVPGLFQPRLPGAPPSQD